MPPLEISHLQCKMNPFSKNFLFFAATGGAGCQTLKIFARKLYNIWPKVYRDSGRSPKSFAKHKASAEVKQIVLLQRNRPHRPARPIESACTPY